MPAVRVDPKMFDDPRFELLGMALGISGDEARFKMCRVYRHCTESETTTVAKSVLDIIAKCDGLSQAILDVGLGRASGDEIYISGSKKHCLWLKERRAASRRGGESNRKRLQNQVPAAGASGLASGIAKGIAKREPKPKPKGSPIAIAITTAKSKSPPPTIPPPPQAPAEGVAAATDGLIEYFNRKLGRRVSAAAWRPTVAKALKAGLTQLELRGIVWWAASTWSDELKTSITPKTLFKLVSPNGHMTAPEYLALAEEFWAQENPGKPAPWKDTSDATARKPKTSAPDAGDHADGQVRQVRQA